MKICNRIKKKFRRKLAAALVAGMMAFSVGVGTVSAADVINISLDETIQRAFENNRTIKESVAEREQAYWTLSEARRQTTPQVTWSWSGQRFGGSYYDGYDYNRSFSHTAGVSIPIYQGGRLREGRKYARYGLSSADLSLENTMQTVRLQSTIYYFDVLQYRKRSKSICATSTRNFASAPSLKLTFWSRRLSWRTLSKTSSTFKTATTSPSQI